MIKQYRKKPVVIEAIQFDGENHQDVSNFTGGQAFDMGSYSHFQTSGKTLTVNCGEYIVKGEDGKFTKCKPDIFEKTYEQVN